MNQRAFVPAAGHDRWLKFYDPLTKLLGASAALRALIDQAQPRPGQRVLDIGCGTGTLAVMLKQRHPQVDVVALDPDPSALERARRKADQASVEITFVQGFGDAIPYPDATFDRVLSSLMLHHLKRDEKVATLAEAHRVMKPGGSIHIVDFATATHRPRGVVARLLHRDEHDTTEGRVAAMLGDAGFLLAADVGTQRTLFGPIGFQRANR